MLTRTLFVMALLTAPLALHPAHLSAQQAGAGARPSAGVTPAMPMPANRPTEVPSGIERAFDGEEVPPGIQRVFPQQEPQPQSEPEVEPEPEAEPEEECAIVPAMVDGQFVLVDCNGDVVDPS